MALDVIALVLIALAGLAAGVASGLFGVGGGVLMVPAILYLVPESDFHLAKAASLFVIVFSAGVGIRAHAKKRSVDVRKGLLLAGGSLVGTALSALFVERIADAWLQAAFGALLVGMGVRLALAGTPKALDLSPAADAALLLAVGLSAGLLAGAFGIGGGVLMVPGLVMAGVGMHLAVGTSLVAVLGSAVSGTATHLALGYGPALLVVGIPLALGAVPGTHLGSLLAHKLHADRLRKAFGAFLVVMGLYLGADAVLF